MSFYTRKIKVLADYNLLSFRYKIIVSHETSLDALDDEIPIRRNAYIPSRIYRRFTQNRGCDAISNYEDRSTFRPCIDDFRCIIVNTKSAEWAREREGNTCKCVWPASGGGRCFFSFSLSLSPPILPPGNADVWCFNVDWTTADSACVRLPRLLFPRSSGREFSKFCTAYIHVAGNT